MEIERKFIVDFSHLDLSHYESIKMVQGYISTNPVIRIRRENNSFKLTMKSGGMMIRQEYEMDISEEQFNHLQTKTEDHLVHKTRYKIPYDNGLIIELDIFEEQLTGLTMAEVEFPSEDAASSFISPTWFLQEVTEDYRYHNSYLSTLANWKKV